ncbi:DUF6415 family natural product biosynthesis protein [Streptomyces sp. HC307]|uniref:DUF6415 family natural product biosynthesis protein n=1 Tax=Streptomyces flavusporus TaxID=3385496 RepID=UPI0039173F53
MNATHDDTEAPTQAPATMRAAATWFLDQPLLPRHGTVKRFSDAFRANVGQLIRDIEQLTGNLPGDDVPAKVALAGVEEARRRLNETERPGLAGEVDRVKRLARSVVALCDHYDALTGVVMCLACDAVIEGGDESVPYDHLSASGGAAQPGRIHTRCDNKMRRRSC